MVHKEIIKDQINSHFTTAEFNFRINIVAGWNNFGRSSPNHLASNVIYFRDSKTVDIITAMANLELSTDQVFDASIAEGYSRFKGLRAMIVQDVALQETNVIQARTAIIMGSITYHFNAQQDLDKILVASGS